MHWILLEFMLWIYSLDFYTGIYIGIIHQNFYIAILSTFQNMSLKYNLDVLREIRQCAKLEANYHLFSLKYVLRMRIIGMGIRKRVWLYRSSRTGKRLHYRISPLVNMPRLHRPRNKFFAQRNYVKITPTVNMQSKKTLDCRCATVNCCSIVNKTSEFKVRTD